LLDRVLAVLGLRRRDHRTTDNGRLLADEPIGRQVAPGGAMGRRAVCLERGVVPVNLVGGDRIGAAVVLESVEARAPGPVLARTAAVLERAFQDLVTVLRLHADLHEQRSHGKFSFGCDWAILADSALCRSAGLRFLIPRTTQRRRCHRSAVAGVAVEDY